MNCEIYLEGEQGEISKNWFKSIGISLSKFKEFIEVEFITPPSILVFLENADDIITIHSISDKGITFYITHIPFTDINNPKKENPLISSYGCGDGYLFCPMTNIVSINTFGKIIRNPKRWG